MKSFIICMESSSDWYKDDDLYETLKAGETTPVGISLRYMEGSHIEQGDLIFVVKVSKTESSLMAVGKAIIDYDEDPDIEGILIQLDFIQEKGREYSIFPKLLKEAGIILTPEINELQLSPEFAEKLLKCFAVHLMQNYFPNLCFVYDPNIDKNQLLCDYLNDYCPEFRKEVIKRFPIIYENYKQGEIIDQDLIDLTYDKSNNRFIGSFEEWERLFEIVRPRA